MFAFIIKSMGCKSNLFESSIIIEGMVSAGFTQVKDIKSADFYILNSCTVTEKSDREALYLLRHAKHQNPDIKTIITGCCAQIKKDRLLEEPFIDYVFGNDDKFDIPRLLKNDIKLKVSDIANEFNYKVLKNTERTRFYLKIQDGCSSHCAYCIIPYARGKSRSADKEFIIEQINRASCLGYKEVVFTGIHIGQWGIEYNKSLADLLEYTEANTTVERYRLGSLNPLEISCNLLDILQNSAKFCPHFHLSLQSACDGTLSSMNRFYKTENYLKQIDDINSRFDNPFIGCDIIAGFPGETDDDFNITVQNLKRSALSKIHTFPYSIRSGTEAEKRNEQIPDDIKKRRVEIIKKISAEKFDAFAKKNLGTLQEVLIEKHSDKKTGLLQGLTRNYLRVLIAGSAHTADCYNTLHKVRILYRDKDKFIGEFVQ